MTCWVINPLGQSELKWVWIVVLSRFPTLRKENGFFSRNLVPSLAIVIGTSALIVGSLIVL